MSMTFIKLQGPFEARATCFWKLHILEVISNFDFDATSFISVALMPGSVPVFDAMIGENWQLVKNEPVEFEK